MNDEWAVNELDVFIGAEGQYGSDTGYPREVKERLIALQPVTEMILDRTLPAWRERKQRSSIIRSEFAPIAHEARRAKALILRRHEIAENLGPTGPQLAAASLHRLVWEAASGLWDDGYYKQAVQTAAVALEGMMQGKAGVDTHGADLGTLFSLKPPSTTSPRLRLQEFTQDSPSWNSAQEGAASMVRGAMQSVRNAVSHAGDDLTEANEALESLAVLSFVCRLVDRAVLVTA
jgi:Protein of unknown function (Hypoth_ymh)